MRTRAMICLYIGSMSSTVSGKEPGGGRSLRSLEMESTAPYSLCCVGPSLHSHYEFKTLMMIDSQVSILTSLDCDFKLLENISH